MLSLLKRNVKKKVKNENNERENERKDYDAFCFFKCLTMKE